MSRRKPTTASDLAQVRCAIYTRKSTEEGLEQAFNTLHAQREAGEAYIASQKTQGWVCLPDKYDDGGFTGANMERPALRRLMADIEAGKVDCVVVYKVDRLSRSLADFARIMETFESKGVSFVSVTQHFHTADSMGRLTLNILLSFAQFEREMISERTRDKIAAARRKGKWMGGVPVLGYDLDRSAGRLTVNEEEAWKVREIFRIYLETGTLMGTARLLNARGWTTKAWEGKKTGRTVGGQRWKKDSVYRLLSNVLYLGQVRHGDQIHPGEHEAIVDQSLWDEVQALLKRGGTGSPVRTKHDALLKGLLVCGPCQKPMGFTYSGKKDTPRYRYYACTRATKEDYRACPSKWIPADEIERFVVERIRHVVDDPRVRQVVMERCTKEASDEVQRLEAELADASASLRRLNGRVAKGASLPPGDKERLTAALDAEERRVASLGRALAEARDSRLARADVGNALRSFDRLWAALTPAEQHRFLHLLIARVEYDGAEGTVSIVFHPGVVAENKEAAA